MDPKKPVITTVGWEVVVRDSYIHERDVMQANFFTITTKVMIQDLDTKIYYMSRKVQTAQHTLWVQLKKTEERLAKDVGARGEVASVTTEKLEREADVCSASCLVEIILLSVVTATRTWSGIFCGNC